ncbi:TPA: hypothetical protein I9080_002131 [Clostridium perfringens]|uniref:Uncharacterized protein n=2 Tax=Clostridium perfringens TaxID=1502 RepID=A0A8H9QYJ0_CLOPF|nr:hypothetical protein [Clostridium perfringens]EDT15772.1 BdrA2 [Clostridium perfringens E str. JGS1987]MCX0408258.1 hypothetical protein [Clostridium perfringens]HAT4308321.1 hypothetical protein [Clostridium perfringens]
MNKKRFTDFEKEMKTREYFCEKNIDSNLREQLLIQPNFKKLLDKRIELDFNSIVWRESIDSFENGLNYKEFSKYKELSNEEKKGVDELVLSGLNSLKEKLNLNENKLIKTDAELDKLISDFIENNSRTK